MGAERIIYDFGANNGDDVAYYLQKADLVVAVEANPALAQQIRRRFTGAVEAGLLIVENCVLTVEANSASVPFYVHKTNHVLSQFPEPAPEELPDFERMVLPSRNVAEIIHTHGEPYYIKIDVEHYDHLILEHLFSKGIVPPYISAESHNIEVFALLVALGKYKAFKLVDGQSVAAKYRNHKIKTNGGEEIHAFPPHSAGPFGEDIAGPWMNRNNFFGLLGFAGLGWKDIHASRVDEPDLNYAPKPQFAVNMRINF